MAESIQTAAVLGSGVMGMGIAAHLAGAGIRTYLLDIVPPNLSDAEKANPAARSRFATSAIEKALKAKPAVFFDPEAARMITPGNFEDHFDKLAQCDFIIEAVVENLDVKRNLFARVAKVAPSHALIASNTSGLSIVGMTEAVEDQVKQRFVVMHFFNPVRYMNLLEIVAGPLTSKESMERATRLGELLGKGVVYGKDTTNFIANRIGIYAIMKTIQTMMRDGFGIEEVDKIVGPPMGRPKTAAFQTGDLVGIDTFMHVAKNCYDSLTHDPQRDIFATPEWIQNLVKKGALGRKSGAGFYKKVGEDIQVLDWKTGEYRAQGKVRYDSLGAVRQLEDPKERLKAFISHEDKAAKFGWEVMAHTLIYSANLLGEIADDIVNVDNAMRWGFNWDMGPFEAWDAIGVEASVKRMQAEGFQVPERILAMLASGRTSFYGGPVAARTQWNPLRNQEQAVLRDPKDISLAALKENKKNIVASNLGATLVDLGDGVVCLEVHTKMNTVDDDVTKMLVDAVALAEKDFEALVIGNEGAHFGAGANLMLIYMGAQGGQWDMIDGAIRAFQNALQGLRYARVPVVAAPFQYTFGGCAEIAMAADACQAHAETYMGLVEVGAGLVPGGGGCLRMAERWSDGLDGVDVDPMPFVAQGSLNIAMAKVATGAEEAMRLRYLKRSDGISLNRSRLLYEAKQRALGMAKAGYRAPRPRLLKAAGLDAAKTMAMRAWALVEGKHASEHDALIAKKVMHILCGGNVAAGTEVNEQHFLDLEREAFLSLCGEEKSQARMASLLMSGKPLRN